MHKKINLLDKLYKHKVQSHTWKQADVNLKHDQVYYFFPTKVKTNSLKFMYAFCFKPEY